MIYLIVICSLAIIIASYLFMTDEYTGPFLGSIMGFFTGAVVGGLITLAVWGCMYPFDSAVHHHYRSDLVNLHDSNGTSGKFFLGIGSVSSTLSVTFYYHDPRGFDVPETVSSDDADIRIYQDSDKPYLDETVTGPHFWTGDLFTGTDTPDELDFHVPAGTVEQNYQLDGQ